MLLDPAVRVAYTDHRRQNVLPCLGLHHYRVREHAAVPADVLKGTRGLARIPSHPVACVAHDVELAVRIGGQTMVACFVMRAGPFHGRIVLRDMEIDGPRAQSGGQSLERRLESLRIPIEIRRKDAVFRSVVAKGKKQRVGHVRLEAQRLRPIDQLEQVYHAVVTLGENRKAIGDGDLRRIVDRVRSTNSEPDGADIVGVDTI